MDKAQAAAMIDKAITQRMEYMKTMAMGIIAQAESNSPEDLSTFIDAIFIAADETIEIMRQSLFLAPNAQYEAMLNAQNAFTLAVIIEALESVGPDKQIAAEAKLKACTSLNPRLKKSLQEDMSIYRDHGGLFDQIKHADKIERLRRLLA
ncbi:hypothetical protein AOB54_01275 [beta proteobacterium MWH-UniP1]